MKDFTNLPDPLDGIMRVMEVAFDPEFGEAWNRRQVSDTLILSNAHFYLATVDNQIISSDDLELSTFEVRNIVGFAMTRHVTDEEELLLIGVAPENRQLGVGKRILQSVIDNAKKRGSRKLFLEMRDGNTAEVLYHKFGFQMIGLRKAYYRRGRSDPLDSRTFSKEL